MSPHRGFRRGEAVASWVVSRGLTPPDSTLPPLRSSQTLLVHPLSPTKMETEKRSPSARNGTVMIEGDYATITLVRRMPHPIAAVWAAITDPEHRAVWFGALSIDPRQGGMIGMV